MATLSELFTLIDTYLPDTGSEINPDDVRTCFNAVVAAFFGQSNVSVTVTDGASSITSAALIGKTVSLIAGEGFSKTSGFTQPDGSGTITFTDGTTLAAGTVLIFFS